jgi:ZIP family zinc transporter
MRVLLNAGAVGILVFLLVEALIHAIEPVEEMVVEAVTGEASWSQAAALALVFTAGLALGLLGLVYYERRVARKGELPVIEPGLSVEAEPAIHRPAWSASKRLALLIAIGIGLHNLAEGLAIGQSAAGGQIGLALVLVVGFGLHNATEGFGIVAPLSNDADRPSWGFLALMGLIGGGPTFVGTLIGSTVVNQSLTVAFLSLASGSIIYVVVQLLKVASGQGHNEMVMWGIFAGLLLGVATEFVVVAASA